MKPRLVFLLALAFVLAMPATRSAPFIWIEAETPTEKNFDPGQDNRRPDLYSAGKAFFHGTEGEALKQLPPEGRWLAYDFTAETAGEYRLWARIGFEWVRANAEWRLDGGEWQTYANTVVTTNLTQIAIWNELAWGDWGLVRLAAGKHRLEVRCRLPPEEPSKPRDWGKTRLLMAFDCFAFTAPDWTPEGRLKPGETYDEERDRTAAAQVYDFRYLFRRAVDLSARHALPLTGPWQIARFDDPDMDKDTLLPVRELPANYPFRWLGLNVPGDAWKARPELAFGHRLVYQTRVEVPADFSRRSFFLHFAGTNYIASVFVNGQFCGGRQSVLVPWDCDVTAAVKPGAVNLVQIALKGPYYAFDPISGKKVTQTRNLPEGFWQHARFLDAVYPSSKGEGHGMAMGIINPVSLVVAGPVYASDVFVRASVAKMTIAATVEVTNPTDAERSVEVTAVAAPGAGGAAELALPPAKVTIKPRSTATVELTAPWPDAKLWWPAEKYGDNPAVYRLRTTVATAGAGSDQRDDTFGFREVSIRGRDILLNGVPWRFYNWVDVPDAGRLTDPQEWLRRYHAQNDGFHRFSADHSRLFGHREQAIEFLDRAGIPSRCSICIDGMFITQDMMSPALWVNWENHVRQVIRAYRNHPAIVHWSIGNEVMLVNAHNVRRGQYLELEKKMSALLAVAQELDPTRPAYEDGAGDCGGGGPINCVHYSWQWYPNVPHDLYNIPTGKAEKRPNERRDTYLWSGENPLIGGEEFYYAGRPSNVAWFGGPSVYRSHDLADLAAGRYARLALEACRWQNVAGACPWTGVLPGGSEKALARRAVFVREYNRCFLPGSEFTRTIKVFNDSRHPGQFVLRWRLVFDGKAVANGEKPYTLAPGMNQEDKLTAKLPAATTRRDGQLELELRVGDAVVFADTRPVSLLPPAAAPALPAGMLAVADPAGGVAAWLTAQKVPFAAVAAPDALPATASCLLVGPQVLTKENRAAWAAAITKLVGAGKTVIVLEQNAPLTEKELPVKGVAVAGPGQVSRERMGEFERQGGHFGSICHPNALAHPVLRGLQAGDFFCWAGDELNYRFSYQAPAGGALVLVSAGDELKLAPMIELPVGGGALVLSQVLIGEKLATEPVAGQLLANLLGWARARLEQKLRPVLLPRPADPGLLGQLDLTRVDYRIVESLAVAFGAKPAGGDGAEVPTLDDTAPAPSAAIVLVPGTAEHLAWLAAHRKEVDALTAAGGWVVLLGLDEGALAPFNQLTGLEHRRREGRTEAVRLAAPDAPLALGLSDRDFSQRGYTMIAPWMQLWRVSGQLFSAVVDAGEDLSAFGAGVPRKLTDGLTKDEFWQYTEYFNSDLSQPVQCDFGRPERLCGVDIWTSGAYFWPREVELVFDDDTASAKRFTLAAKSEMQTLDFPPRAARQLTLRVVSLHDQPSSKPLYTIDELRVRREVPPALAQRALALTAPAGIVAYPRGKGGLLLNCLRWEETPDPAKDERDTRTFAGIRDVNLQKKRAILTALLRNCGAAFLPAQ